MISFHGAGISVGPKISSQEVAKTLDDHEEVSPLCVYIYYILSLLYFAFCPFYLFFCFHCLCLLRKFAFSKDEFHTQRVKKKKRKREKYIIESIKRVAENWWKE